MPRGCFCRARCILRERISGFAYLGVALESAIIDIGHWRHYFLILGALCGLMVASRRDLAKRGARCTLSVMPALVVGTRVLTAIQQARRRWTAEPGHDDGARLGNILFDPAQRPGNIPRSL
jgi:hypothetical protein